MVAVVPLLVSLAGLSTAVFQVLKPRLPPYAITVIKLPMPSWVDGQIMTQLHADVKLHNDNFVAIDVHSLAFDLFYPDLGGELTHIGRVFDGQKKYRTEECLAEMECRILRGLDKPLWALQARSDFGVQDNVFASLSLWGLAKTFLSILSNLIKGGGHLVIPTTGVMQIKASSSTPVTMSMICDNSLNIWTMALVGVDCSLNSLDVGWLEINGSIDKLQEEVLANLKANATGGVLANHKAHAGTEKKIEQVWKTLHRGVSRTTEKVAA